jgi:galactokinase
VIRVTAPGRVNLIGGHTDYTGGLVLPMAIDLATTIEGERGGDHVWLKSEDEPDVADVSLLGSASGGAGWARYVAAVVAALRPASGFRGTVSTTIPIGTGLSSSAALEVGVALALGAADAPHYDVGALAQTLREAEHAASGVPCGIMDQLASLAGVAGHAVLLDCTTLDVTPVPVPSDVDVVVVDSGQRRRLSDSGYADRRAEVATAEQLLGHLPSASLRDVDAISDAVVRMRARHVVTENARVHAFVDALRSDDRAAAGEIMIASHASLRDDHEVTTPELDALVERLCATAGVWGARLTGGGWGGCVVALTEPGVLAEGCTVRPSAGARVDVL